MLELIVKSIIRLFRPKWIIICIVLSFILGCYIAAIPILEIEIVQDDINDNRINDKTEDRNGTPYDYIHPALKKLAILVPFRERFPELLEFVPHMHFFLKKQHIKFDIFVVQQVDLYRFNRASLINVGFIYTKEDYDYIAMHDVDLLPINDELIYKYPKYGPLHISAPNLHPKYHYETYIGGILLIRKEHFELVNGMSNKYWGWGLEDDEFYVRLKDAGLAVKRPENIHTGQNNSFRHNHEVSPNRRRDMRKCYNQHEETRRRDRHTGVRDVNYSISSVHDLLIDTFPVTVINVELRCNNDTTPWCRCPEPPKTTTTKKRGTKKR